MAFHQRLTWPALITGSTKRLSSPVKQTGRRRGVTCNVRAFGRFDLVPNPFQDFGVGAINPGVILSPFHIYFCCIMSVRFEDGKLELCGIWLRGHNLPSCFLLMWHDLQNSPGGIRGAPQAAFIVGVNHGRRRGGPRFQETAEPRLFSPGALGRLGNRSSRLTATAQH